MTVEKTANGPTKIFRW